MHTFWQIRIAVSYIFFLLIKGHLRAKQLCKLSIGNGQLEWFMKISDGCPRIFFHHSYDICIITSYCVSRSTSSRLINYCFSIYKLLIKFLESAFADLIFLRNFSPWNTAFTIFNNQALIRNLSICHIYYLSITVVFCSECKQRTDSHKSMFIYIFRVIYCIYTMRLNEDARNCKVVIFFVMYENACFVKIKIIISCYCKYCLNFW